MKKFLVLYGSSVPASEQMANTSPEQAKAGMEAWMAWAKKAGPALVDLGTPLGRSAKVTPSSVSAARSNVAGFSIVQGDSRDAVTELLKSHPHFMAPGAAIEVLEFLPLPGV